MRIGMLMARHPAGAASPLMPEVVRLLGEWGASVDLLYPDDRCTALRDLRVEHDLYVLRSETELALSVAGALHAVGGRVLNPWPAAALMKDRVAALRRMAECGVRVPECHLTSSPRLLASLLEEGPLVLKPPRGGRADPVRVVWDAEELDGAASDGAPVLAQRYHRPDGPDHKIYCIGGQLFGVRRSWPARTYREKCGEPFTLTSELRDIALRCAAAFGVELFGIDLLFSGGVPYAVDIHNFPGFKGVPDAALRLADYVYAAAHGARAGEPPAVSAFPSAGSRGVSA